MVMVPTVELLQVTNFLSRLDFFKPHRAIEAAFEIDAARIFHFE